MRLALYHNLPSGGAKRAVYEWVRRLRDQHTIDVYSIDSADHDYCDIRPFVREHHVYSFRPRRLFHSPLGRLNQFQRLQDIRKLRSLHADIAQEINQRDYDLVFVNPSLFTHVPPLLKYLKIPSIYYLHEPVGQADQRKIHRPYHTAEANSVMRQVVDRLDPILNRYHRELEDLQLNNLRAANVLLANSAFTLHQMQNTYGNNIPCLAQSQNRTTVCYLGVDAEFFRPLPGISKEWAVLSVGELSPRKGFDFLIESLALIPVEKRPTLRLASNWEDVSERGYLTTLAASRQVQVHFLGRLDNEALRVEYNRAQICVYAPLLEPFGLVPLESMACGLAVIGVAEAGVCETVKDQVTGLLVERNTGVFAQAVERLLANQSRLALFGSAGRQIVLKQWDWTQAVERLNQWFDLVTLPEDSGFDRAVY